ncbi:NAD(P)-binding protein [Daldinia caldariorum]|uniref:NAD(P)-binding protein n=1 Tax=Daldinia caldariorum TaxID=326644 RepID=UPI00200736EE|nr:NAD(P)-binding protein [Daldinia caldariorum]KAI1465807.1 NAD(P)-binding protein [Daldinia caldariorum]
MATSKDLPPLDVGFGSIFVKNQFRTKPQYPPSTTDLTGKVALITGANTGLGYEAGKQMLALRLSHLIIAVRSKEKGDAAASKLRSLYPKAKVEVMIVDMSKYNSVQEFVRNVDSKLYRLDIAILNAGVIKLKHATEPSTGHEQILQVNYLSTVLLAILLLPILKKKSPPGTPGRLTVVNAALALTAPLPKPDHGHESIFATLDDPKSFVPNTDKTYNMSKFLGQMFAYKLGEYVSADDVVVNFVCPGYVRGTDLGREASVLIRPAVALFAAVAGRSTRDGASTYLDAALVKGKESHCSFIMSWKVSPFNSFLYTPEGKDTADQVFEETMKELEFADARGILESMKTSAVVFRGQ